MTQQISAQGRRLVGVAAKFNTLSNNLGDSRQRVREILRPGCFDGPVNERQDTLFLLDHELPPYARVGNGSLKLWSDSIGLRFEAELLDTQAARDLITCVRGGLIRSMSFGFTIEKDNWSRNDRGEMVREIRAIQKLGDISAVALPAYPETELGLRFTSLELQQAWDRIRLLEVTGGTRQRYS